MADVASETNTPPKPRRGPGRPEDIAQRLWDRTRESVMEMSDNLDLEGRVRREPYKMVAIAAGVGFVLAGGLVSPLTARVLGLGMRVGLRAVAVPLLQAAAMSALWNRFQSEDEGDPDSTPSRRKAQPRAETQESQQEKNHERTGTKRS